MDTLRQDVRFALRNLVGSPLSSALAVVCLALGIGANATMFSVVDSTIVRPLPFADPEELVAIWSARPQSGVNRSSSSFADFADWREQTRTFAEIAAAQVRSLSLTDTDEPERVSAAAISASLLPMLGISPVLGRHFSPADDTPGVPGVILLSDELWRRRYNADPAIVGRVLKVNGAPYTAIGVLPPRVKFPFNQVAWIPLSTFANRDARGERNLMVFGRLKPGVTLAQAQDDLGAVARRLGQTFPEDQGWSGLVRPLTEFFMPSEVRLVTLTAMGAVTLVLLIACSNVANLLLARATVRGREMALRTALGAGRARLVRQLLTESVALGVASIPLGILLTRVGVALLDAAVPFDDIPYLIGWRVDARTLAYTIAAAAGTGLLFGLAPVAQLSRTNLVNALREGGRTGGGGARGRARNSLVILEVALSLVLLVGASLFVRSFLNLQRASGGFDTAPLLTLRFYMTGDTYQPDGAKARRVQDVIRRVEEIPGVDAAAASNLIPLDGGGDSGRVEIEGLAAEPGEEPRIFVAGVTPHFFKTLGVPLIRGRDFQEVEGEGRSGVAIVNVTMSRRFFDPGATPAAIALGSTTILRGAADLGAIDPVGRRFRLLDGSTGTWFTIVGVVPDIHTDQLSDRDVEPSAFISYPHQETPNTGLTIRVHQDPSAVASAVRQALRASDPAMPVFSVRTMEDVRRRGFWQYGLFGWMFSIFGGLALVFAVVGVYGVLSYTVSQRTQELGVRMALGASGGRVLRMLVLQGLRLAGAGVVLGLVGAVGITRVLRSLLYDVTPTDPLSFVSVVVLLAGTAGLASYLPARRATRLDPVEALRRD